MSKNCGSNYIYYTAHFNGKEIGRYRQNMAYNTLYEIAELVAKKIHNLYKPRKFHFDLKDVQQRVVYRYAVNLTTYTFLEYGDYRIGHEKDIHGCDMYHPNVIMPVLVDTIYPDMIVPKTPYWAGEKIPGLFRDDVFNYIHGKWYGN